MKKIEVKVRYLFEGTYTVATDDRNEAHNGNKRLRIGIGWEHPHYTR